MSKLIESILCTIIGLAFIVGVYVFISDMCTSIQGAFNEGYYTGYSDGLKAPQSIGETQKILQGLGFYKGRIDYEWGPLTERAYCDYQASKYFEGEYDNE